MRKGIILSGGLGSRLFPLTFTISKQLLPINDKPMIFYPLTTLIQLGIKDILIICKTNDKKHFQNLFGDGSDFGIKISYEIQNVPRGIAEGLIIAEKFLSNSPCVFILGDNLFIGDITFKKYKKLLERDNGACVFTYKVKDPHRYGILELNSKNKVVKIIEKPKEPKSNNAITGLYFYDRNAPKIAKTLTPSKRNELEITDLNNKYLLKNKLSFEMLDDSTTWLDAGTISSLYEASNLVSAIEKRSGSKIGCIEIASFKMNNIDQKQLKKLQTKYKNSEYGTHLQNFIDKL